MAAACSPAKGHTRQAPHHAVAPQPSGGAFLRSLGLTDCGKHGCAIAVGLDGEAGSPVAVGLDGEAGP